MTPDAELAHVPVGETAETSPFAEQFWDALDWLQAMLVYVRHGDQLDPNPVDRLEEMKASLMDIACELIVRGFFMPDIPDWSVHPMGALEGWSDWLEKAGPHAAINDQLAHDFCLSRFAVKH